MTIAVCIAGATGWAGRAIAEAVLAAPDLHLRSAVARSAAGQDLGSAWGAAEVGVPVTGSVDDALAGVDVLVDFTSHHAARQHVLTALADGISVVLGTSGLTAADFDEIDAAAWESGAGSSRPATSRSPRRWPRPRRCWSPRTCRTARSSTMRRRASRTRRAAPRASWPSGSARSPGRCSTSPSRRRRAPGGPRGDGRRHPGALGAAAELRGVDRGGVRAARRAADDPPRRGRHRRRRTSPARCWPCARGRATRAGPRTGHAAAGGRPQSLTSARAGRARSPAWWR